MILSHKHRFVFIKGLKVAGTSAEIALSQICGPEDIVTPITPVDERLRIGTSGVARNYASSPELEQSYLRTVAEQPADALGQVRAPRGPFYNHMSLEELLTLIPKAADYRLLFVERSPYDKVLSFANWQAHQRSYKEGRSLPGSGSDLSASVARIIEGGTIAKVRNIDRYRAPDGSIPSDGWRYERLEEDLAGFFRECGEAPVPLAHAKKGVNAGGLDVRQVLGDEQIAFIDSLFADEFRTFGYAMAGDSGRYMPTSE